MTKAARPVLYHGTSSFRLRTILREGVLRRSPVGHKAVSLTPEHPVAEYFARNAAFGDIHDHPGEDSTGVVLQLRLARVLRLRKFSDPVWGNGECDWEQEIACWDDVALTEDTLIAVLPVREESRR
jgi:hypothetical protein